VKAFLLACLVVAASVGIALLARPWLVTTWHTVYVAVAWPAQAAVSSYEMTQHPHWITAIEHKGWRGVGWTRWMLPAWRAHNYRALHAATRHARLVRWAMLAEVVAVLVLAGVPLVRKVWGPVWFVIGRAGKLAPGTAHGAGAIAGTHGAGDHGAEPGRSSWGVSWGCGAA